ncbi:response regulator transcription factor [Candidatus Microgenomates bacterium]|nr:response regulator transcription factor [Candidatus Microgenomates bacterium]
MRLLIVDDDRRIARVLERSFRDEGLAVDLSFDGEDGNFLATTEDYDIIILDLMLPKMNGLTICQNIRMAGIKTPILILSARNSVDDKEQCLNAGADDYLEKPFSFRELNARIHALIRRATPGSANILKVDDLELDPIRHLTRRSGQELTLSPKEFAILEYLMRHKDEVITRTKLLEHVWDYNFDSMSNVVDVFIASLRKKIDSGFPQKLIKTIHGVGFKICVL